MIYVVKINDKEYEVEVERGKANIIKTTTVVNTPPVVSAPVAQAAPAPVPQAANVNISGGEVVKAPMPGMIMDIKVNVGSSVKKGDILLILEAMKMENEIVSPVDGVIKQVVAVKGAKVETNDALLVIG